MFIDDIITILQNAGVGTLNSNIFGSTKADVPSGDGPYLSVRATGGTSPENTHNSTTRPAYLRPGAQLVVTAKSYKTAESMAVKAFNALFPIRNQLIGSGWHRRIRPIQSEPVSYTHLTLPTS